MAYTPPDRFVPAPGGPVLQAARERAIALLTDRYADDSLSEAEFEARLQWLSLEGSASRIEDLVAELSVPRAAPWSTSQVVAQPFVAEDRLLAVMSSSRRTGQWVMPGRLHVRAVMSELEIDLRYATLPVSGSIDVTAVMANVRIIAPPELAVECRVAPFMGSVRNDAADTTYPGYGAPRLVVTGSCIMSEVRIEAMLRVR